MVEEQDKQEDTLRHQKVSIFSLLLVIFKEFLDHSIEAKYSERTILEEAWLYYRDKLFKHIVVIFSYGLQVLLGDV
jgi:hypothetical protein